MGTKVEEFNHELEATKSLLGNTQRALWEAENQFAMAEQFDELGQVVEELDTIRQRFELAHGSKKDENESWVQKEDELRLEDKNHFQFDKPLCQISDGDLVSKAESCEIFMHLASIHDFNSEIMKGKEGNSEDNKEEFVAALMDNKMSMMECENENHSLGMDEILKNSDFETSLVGEGAMVAWEATTKRKGENLQQYGIMRCTRNSTPYFKNNEICIAEICIERIQNCMAASEDKQAENWVNDSHLMTALCVERSNLAEKQ